MLGAKDGRVDVSWHVADTGARSIAVPDLDGAGPGPEGEPARREIGTEILTRMLAYDLKAETELMLGLGALRCTLSLPLPQHVGRVVPG